MDVFTELRGQTLCFYCRDKESAQLLERQLKLGCRIYFDAKGGFHFDPGYPIEIKARLAEALESCKVPAVSYALRRKLEGCLLPEEEMKSLQHLKGLERCQSITVEEYQEWRALLHYPRSMPDGYVPKGSQLGDTET